MRCSVNAFKRSQHIALGVRKLCGIEVRRGRFCRKFGGGLSGAAPEDEKIRERIAAEAICAMQTCSRFPGGEKTRNRACGRFGLDADAAHHVVARGTDFHRPFGYVHIS